VHHEPINVNDPTTGHRLATSAIGSGDNQCNRTGCGHRKLIAPPVKATHVEVDAGAWRFLKAWAARWHRPLADIVSQLVRSAVMGGVPVEDAIEPTAPVELSTGPGRRARAFARLPGIDDPTWDEFRAEATEAGVTVARAVGILAEFAAAEIRRQLGELADPSHVHPT